MDYHLFDIYQYYKTKQIPRDTIRLYFVVTSVDTSVLFKIPIPSQLINSRDTTNMFSSDGVKYPCGQCGKQFSQKGTLVRHLRTVHEEAKYPCGQCGKQFSQKGSLDEHQRSVHEGVKYPCGQCGKQFSQKGNLARHHKSVHKSQ